MSSQPPRTSVFSFESAVHSSYLLECLNEQRLRDVLCDVTVVVQDKSFRAHCSVLASCSEYFQSRVSSLSRQCPVIILPEQVSAEGFEPLLNFAYTSRLLFTKENIHDIHSSADFLGFQNLELACFDFLLPKFSEAKQAPQDSQQTCCRKRLLLEEFPMLSPESSQPATFNTSSSASLRENGEASIPSNCPLQSSQTSNKEDHLCLDNCGPQMTPLSLDFPESSVCPMLSMQCSDSSKAGHPAQFCEKDMLDIGEVCNQSELADCGLPCDLQTSGDPNRHILIEPASESNGNQSMEILRPETSCNQCPFTSGTDVCSDTEVSFEQNMSADLSQASISVLSQEEGFEERSSVEREVAEHLAKGFWSDLCPTQPADPSEQEKMSKAADFHWLKQLDLSSSMEECPFLRDLRTGEVPSPSTDSLSQSLRSPCMSSGNSGEDSELDTDGDTEANKRRAAEIKLPFPVEQISTLTRSEFQQILKQHVLNEEQHEFVHDVRRRSKNRMAARRCRKRKLDGIQQLQCQIKTLRSEKERLLQERVELEQSLEAAHQSLRCLCKTSEPGSDLNPASPSSPDFTLPSPVSSCKSSQVTMETVQCSSDATVAPAADSFGNHRPQLDSESGRAGSPVPRGCPIAESLYSLNMDSY